MFLSLRYIILLVYGLIIGVCITGGIYFKYYTVEHLIKHHYQKEAVSFTQLYMNSIWNRYYPVIAFLSDKSIVQAKTYPQYMSYAKESDNFFHSNKILKTIIHLPTWDIYSSNDNDLKNEIGLIQSIIGSKAADNTRINAQHTTSMISEVKINNQSYHVVKVYVPFKSNNSKLNDNSNPVIEFIYDVNSELKIVSIIQIILISVVILGFGIIVISMLISLSKINKTLDKQQETTVELSSARAKAEAENKEKSKFLANVSHELRTPLNAIIGFSEIITTEAMGPLNNDQYKEFVKDIHTSGMHLLSLINDILDFSKAEEDKLEVDLEEVDLTKVIKVSLRMVMPRAEEAKISLKEVLPEEHLMMRADSKRLKQVLLNILTNSIKFTLEGGIVTIKAWKNTMNDSIVIEIIDTGVGMEAQDIAKALAPFGQVDNKLSRRYEGTGLGLPLTKRLVELMRGKFDIKSEPGLGTTLTLTFPLSDSKAVKPA